MADRSYRRRTILAGLGGLVAGCSGQSSETTAAPTSTETEIESESSPSTSTETSTATTRTTEEPVSVREWPDSYYQGPMVSAHEHMNGPDGYEVASEGLSGLIEWMDRNRVEQVMAIAGDYLREDVVEYDDRLVPFAFGYASLRNQFDNLAAAFRERLEEFPAYDGIGEIGLKGQLTPAGEPPVPADHPQMMELYGLAAEEDVPVMLHTVAPWRYEGAESDWDDPSEYPPFQQLDRAMAQHRDTDFLIHASYQWNGIPDGQLVAKKLKQHPNLYYDISPTGPTLMWGHGSFTEEEFKSEMGENGIESEIQRHYKNYAEILENHSERVLWGMDASNEWHYEDWALNTFLDIARGILGRLPEENARNIGYRTAAELFDISVSGQPN